jgi:hypothetical protein
MAGNFRAGLMSGPFPNLLVATEFPPNASGGGPAVVRQMLRDWPAEKLFWWSCVPELDQKFGRQVAAHAVAAIPEKIYPHRRWCLQKSWVLENLWTPWAAGHFKQTIKKFRPEVAWVIPHGWAIPPLAKTLPPSGLGFHTTMQDYMDINSYAARYGTARSRRLSALADLLYARATTRDATSHPMNDDLLARTGAPSSQMLHAGIEQEEVDYLRSLTPGPADHIRIAHAGSIQLEDVFALFVKALQQIRGRLPRPVTLEFFGNHSYRSRPWFDSSWMNERGNLPAAQLTGELRKCAWGFSPMALTDEDPRYNRLSFPTKFISYLAAGLPVITLGHPESSVVKMARAYNVGVCLTTDDVRQISDQLAGGLAAASPQSAYLPEIRRCVLTEFDADRMRALLYDNFRTCARQSRGAFPSSGGPP